MWLYSKIVIHQMIIGKSIFLIALFLITSCRNRNEAVDYTYLFLKEDIKANQQIVELNETNSIYGDNYSKLLKKLENDSFHVNDQSTNQLLSLYESVKLSHNYILSNHLSHFDSLALRLKSEYIDIGERNFIVSEFIHFLTGLITYPGNTKPLKIGYLSERLYLTPGKHYDVPFVLYDETNFYGWMHNGIVGIGWIDSINVAYATNQLPLKIEMLNLQTNNTFLVTDTLELKLINE